MKLVLVTLVLAVAVLAAAPKFDHCGRVTNVIDADTIAVEGLCKNIRLADIDPTNAHITPFSW